MNPQGHVLVIGAAGIDYKGYPETSLQLDTSNPGLVRQGFGGVARNIAENLARLEVPVVLLTALGQDQVGDLVYDHCHKSGIKMDYVMRCPDAQTGTYVAVFNNDGDLMVAVSDNRILNQMDQRYLDQHLEVFAKARMVVADLNLPISLLEHILSLAEKYDLQVVIDPTSPARAEAVRPYISRIYMITPNAAETTSLCGLEIPAHNLDSAVTAAHQLVNLGVRIAIVTMGSQGLAYAESNGTGHISAVRTQVVDTTGAGDALTAGVIFGLVNDIPLDEAMRLGVTAASITLQSQESVAPRLTPDLLYDSLVL